jgi:hypothetical protein
MKRKILIAILLMLVLSQVPFVYRRYRLSRLSKTIQQLSAQRIEPSNESQYVDYSGVIHVHSSLGGHSQGTLAELLAAAKANQLDFVIMTEHPQPDFDTSALTLNGQHAGVLFVNGNEVSTSNGDRLLLIPGSPEAASASTQTTQQIVEQQKANRGLAIAAYPAESENWKSTNVDGVEVYNLFTNAREIRTLTMFFDGLWSYRNYPELIFANFFARPSENLQRWENAIAAGNRKLIGLAGNDAHSNLGIGVNDSTGKSLLGVKLDPYARSFRIVRTHVLIPKDKSLTRESLLEALAQGHCYISFDLFSSAEGFRFGASNSEKIMGDEVAASSQPNLIVSTPLPARIALMKNGSLVEQKSGTEVEFTTAGAGSYRVEIYLDSLPQPATGKPWILSNPIYVR